MTDDEMKEASRAITVTSIEALAHLGLDPLRSADVIGFALLEALGQLLGSAGSAIERMRDVADVAERILLRGGNPTE